MSYHVDSEHIQALIEQGFVKCLSCDVSAEAERYLESMFPLRVSMTLVSWDRLAHKSLNWMDASDDEAAKWASSTLSGIMPYGLLLYNPSQPCLIGTLDFMIRNLDTLVWKAPGSRILFGVDLDSEGTLQFSRGIIEYNGVDKLFATSDF